VARTDGSKKIALFSGHYELCSYWELHLTLRSVVRIRFPAWVLQVVACMCGIKCILRYSSKDIEHG